MEMFLIIFGVVLVGAVVYQFVYERKNPGSAGSVVEDEGISAFGAGEVGVTGGIGLNNNLFPSDED